MRRIADDAGVSLGVAYNYFESKEALFGAMLDRVAERLSARVVSGPDGRVMLVSLWEAMEDNPAFQRLMTRSSPISPWTRETGGSLIQILLGG